MHKKPKKTFKQHFRSRVFTINWRKPRITNEVKKFLEKDQGIWAATYDHLQRIDIDPKVKENERTYLETVLDEGLHACQPDLDNWAVEQIAEDLADFLLRLGFKAPNK